MESLAYRKLVCLFCTLRSMGEELVTDEKILEYIQWRKRQKLSFKETMSLFEDSHGLEIRKRLVYPYSDRLSRTDIEYSSRDNVRVDIRFVDLRTPDNSIFDLLSEVTEVLKWIG